MHMPIVIFNSPLYMDAEVAKRSPVFGCRRHKNNESMYIKHCLIAYACYC